MELLNKWFGMFGATSESTAESTSRSNVRLIGLEHPEPQMPHCFDDSRIEMDDPIDTSTYLIDDEEETLVKSAYDNYKEFHDLRKNNPTK